MKNYWARCTFVVNDPAGSDLGQLLDALVELELGGQLYQAREPCGLHTQT